MSVLARVTDPLLEATGARRALSTAQEYVAAASPRERRLLQLAAAGVVGFVVLVTWGSFNRAISRAQDALDEKQQVFEKIQKLAGTFNQRDQERQLLEAKLRQSPPALMSWVDELTKAQQIEIGSISNRGVVSGGQAGRPAENSVEVNLGKVPLDKLTRLLQAIDQSPGVVRVRRLRVRRTPDNKEALDVTLTISAWQGT